MPEFPRRFVPRVPGPAWAWASAIAVLGFQPLSLAAQGGTSGTVRVFLDCQGVFCDPEYVLQEIHWIDWVSFWLSIRKIRLDDFGGTAMSTSV